jgi:glyoxylase-like metal-dependent hydrolase (beta-lactamase superfamily II)
VPAEVTSQPGRLALVKRSAVKLSSPNVETVLDGYRLGSDQGAIAFCSITLIEGLDDQGKLKRILVDTGHTGRRPALDAALRQRGLTRDSIDTVVCTHAHWDHIENLDIFPQAKIVMHPDERRYARRPHRNDFAVPDWTDALLARYEHRIRTVEEGTALLPGVEIVAAPGHSAGTIAVAVATSDGIAVITGDSIQNATVARERRNALVFWNNEQATMSISKLLAIGDIIYPGHDLPFRLHADGRTEYLHDMELTLTGVEAGQPGLTLQPDREVQQTIMPGIEEQRLHD